MKSLRPSPASNINHATPNKQQVNPRDRNRSQVDRPKEKWIYTIFRAKTYKPVCIASQLIVKQVGVFPEIIPCTYQMNFSVLTDGA